MPEDVAPVEPRPFGAAEAPEPGLKAVAKKAMANALTTNANQMVFFWNGKWHHQRLANANTPEKGQPFLVYRPDGDLIQFDGKCLTHYRWR